MFLVHLFVYFARVNFCPSSSYWCQGLTETSDCGSPGTFLSTFVQDLELDCVRSRSFSHILLNAYLTLCADNVLNAHNYFLTKRFSNSTRYLYCRWS